MVQHKIVDPHTYPLVRYPQVPVQAEGIAMVLEVQMDVMVAQRTTIELRRPRKLL